jgi:hypothetical protein
MNTADDAVFTSRAVRALNKQKRSIAHDPRFHRRHVEADGGGEAHHEGFVLGRR